MKNLVVDIGNTRIKAASFHNGKLAEVFFLKVISELKNLMEGHYKFGFSSVTKEGDAFIAEARNKYPNVLELTHHTPLPFVNKYQTPETLGRDRLANIAGALTHLDKVNCLVIDFGTCIKYDFINQNNEYLGGAISAGMQMRFAALHTTTSNLPLITPENYSTLIGNTTKTSILSGVMTAIAMEVNGFIQAYQREFENLQVIITGGDHNYFAKEIKSLTFADQNLQLKGLNHILELQG